MSKLKRQQGLLDISIIAAELGLTHQRVSQILKVALLKFRNGLENRNIKLSDIL